MVRCVFSAAARHLNGAHDRVGRHMKNSAVHMRQNVLNKELNRLLLCRRKTRLTRDIGERILGQLDLLPGCQIIDLLNLKSNTKNLGSRLSPVDRGDDRGSQILCTGIQGGRCRRRRGRRSGLRGLNDGDINNDRLGRNRFGSLDGDFGTGHCGLFLSQKRSRTCKWNSRISCLLHYLLSSYLSLSISRCSMSFGQCIPRLAR